MSHLAAEVKVENNSGKAFEDVELEVVPGEVGRPYFPTHYRPRIRRMRTMAFMAAEEISEMAEVEIAEEKGQIVYSFGKRNLPEGSSKFGIFHSKALDYDILYRAKIGENEIKTTLKFKAPITLPTGSVAVFGEKENGERYEGGGTLSNTLKDKDAKISLRTPDTLKIKTELEDKKIIKTDIGTETAPIYGYESLVKVTATNASKEDATIETILQLYNTEKLIESSLEPSETKKSRVKWDVKIPAGKDTSFTYKTQNAQFKAVHFKELKDRLKD